MSVQSEWLIQQHVLLVTTGETFTAQELAETGAVFNPRYAPVFMIVDDHLIRTQPSIASFARTEDVDSLDNLHCVLVVGAKTPTQRSAAQMAARYIGKPVVFCNDLSAAMEYIYVRQPELRELAPEFQS